MRSTTLLTVCLTYFAQRVAGECVAQEEAVIMHEREQQINEAMRWCLVTLANRNGRMMGTKDYPINTTWVEEQRALKNFRANDCIWTDAKTKEKLYPRNKMYYYNLGKSSVIVTQPKSGKAVKRIAKYSTRNCVGYMVGEGRFKPRHCVKNPCRGVCLTLTPPGNVTVPIDVYHSTTGDKIEGLSITVTVNPTDGSSYEVITAPSDASGSSSVTVPCGAEITVTETQVDDLCLIVDVRTVDASNSDSPGLIRVQAGECPVEMVATVSSYDGLILNVDSNDGSCSGYSACQPDGESSLTYDWTDGEPLVNTVTFTGVFPDGFVAVIYTSNTNDASFDPELSFEWAVVEGNSAPTTFTNTGPSDTYLLLGCYYADSDTFETLNAFSTDAFTVDAVCTGA